MQSSIDVSRVNQCSFLHVLGANSEAGEYVVDWCRNDMEMSS